MFWYTLGSVSTFPKACFSCLMQQLNQISAGAYCLSVLITKYCFILFWSLAMKSIVSVFLFSHWSPTQSTNKRANRVAWFYSTNLQTYILYILFALIFTINYNIPFPYPSNYYLLLVLKICEPPDLFLSPKHLAESKRHFQRCMYHLLSIYFLGGPSGPPCMQCCCLHIFNPFILFHQVIPLPK